VKRILLIIVLTFGLAKSHSAQSAATIDGVVLDAATGEPLPGVRVSLPTGTPPVFNPLQGPPVENSATTNSQGHFLLETKEFGRARVVPRKDGYIYSRPGQSRAPAEPGVWVQVSPGDRIKDLELRMARPASISGRVLTAEGQPIVGNAGSVTLMRYSYGTDGERALNWVPGITYGGAGSFQRMNDKGEFRFYDLPPGDYYLRVEGGNRPIGSSGEFYYPGVTDELKATPIRVEGADIQLGLLTLTPRQPGTEVKLRFTGSPEPIKRANVRMMGGSGALIFMTLPNPGEILLPFVAPGRHELHITSSERSSLGPGLVYGTVTLDVGNSRVDQEVVLKPGPSVTTTLLVEDERGRRSPAPTTLRCRLTSRFGLSTCSDSRVVPGIHKIELEGLAANTYVLSAKMGDDDILAEGLNIGSDANLQIVIGVAGAIVQGAVRDAKGAPVFAATVAVVPDEPYRATGLLYRSVITDPNGKFEIHGIAPGSYKLFAWPELEGAAYRNAEFMKEYEDRGKPVKVEKGGRASVDLTTF
jgi:hypothetical protein